MRGPKARKVMIKATTLLLALFATVTAAVPSVPQHIVSLRSSRFEPASLVIRAGDIVTFQNRDSMEHTVTADDLRFDSGAIPARASWSHRFTRAGRFGIFCAYHPKMIATIAVKQKR